MQIFGRSWRRGIFVFRFDECLNDFRRGISVYGRDRKRRRRECHCYGAIGSDVCSVVALLCVCRNLNKIFLVIYRILVSTVYGVLHRVGASFGFDGVYIFRAVFVRLIMVLCAAGRINRRFLFSCYDGVCKTNSSHATYAARTNVLIQTIYLSF